jgi:sugar lactone lactonase YvrE
VVGLLAVVAWAGGGSSPVGFGQPAGAAPTTAAAPVVVPGVVVAAERKTGTLVAVDEKGHTTTLATGLSNPNGVASLSDGSVVAADSAHNQIVGVSGRFGPDLKVLVPNVTFPEGLTVGADGTVYVTLFSTGEVGRLDLDAGTYTKIAGGLQGPTAVAERDGDLYVTEAAGGAGDVVQLAPDGTKTVVASGFQQPSGIGAGPGKTLYVADYGTGKLAKIDDSGARSDLANLDGPLQVALEPHSPTPGIPFAVIVATSNGVERFDANGRKVGTPVLTGVSGVATVAPPPVAAPPTTAAPVGTTVGTAVAPIVAAGTVPQDTAAFAPGAAADPAPTTTSPQIELSSGPMTSTIVWVIVLGILAALAIAAVLWGVLRKPRGSEEAGFEERPLDTQSVAEAFGPCAAQEVELAEAEGALDALTVQLRTAEDRAADAAERAIHARQAESEASDAVTVAEVARRADEIAGIELDPIERHIEPEDLHVRTEAGKVALEAFQHDEISLGSLRSRWEELEEQAALGALDTITEERERGAARSLDEYRSERARERAGAEVQLAEEDREHADHDIERLQERRTTAMERITEARRALEACQAAHRDDIRRRHREAPKVPDLLPDLNTEPVVSGADDANDRPTGDEATPDEGTARPGSDSADGEGDLAPTGPDVALAFGSLPPPPPPPPPVRPAGKPTGLPTPAELFLGSGRAAADKPAADEPTADKPRPAPVRPIRLPDDAEDLTPQALVDRAKAHAGSAAAETDADPGATSDPEPEPGPGRDGDGPATDLSRLFDDF